MSYTQALMIAYDRQLFGAQAYAQARSPGETRSSKTIFGHLCFDAGMRRIRTDDGIDSTERTR